MITPFQDLFNKKLQIMIDKFLCSKHTITSFGDHTEYQVTVFLNQLLLSFYTVRKIHLTTFKM